MSAGTNHSLARTASGALYGWGQNTSGQLGLGNTTNKTTPTLVSGLTLDRLLSAGGTHSLGLRDDGVLLAWGLNSSGQLGDTTTAMRTSPVVVQGPAIVALVAGGGTHSAAVTPDGHVWTWGANASGQLGDGSTTGHSTPANVMTLAGTWGATPTPRLSLAPGTYHTTQATVVTAMTGAVIHYTMTGDTPTESDAVLNSGDSVAIDTNLTLGLRAWAPGLAPSDGLLATYVLQPDTPTAIAPGGPVRHQRGRWPWMDRAVRPSDTRWTATTPTESSADAYSSPIGIGGPTTLTAKAFRSGWTPSASLVAGYQFRVPFPIAEPSAGAYPSAQTVTLEGPVGATMHYTLNGTAPTGGSPVYSAPLTISSSLTLRAIAVAPGWTNSYELAQSYVISSGPVITGVSPSSGAAGTTVSVAGIQFGNDQGSAVLWLGTKPGVIVSWTDTEIVATVATGSQSGTVQVRWDGWGSNTMPFGVATATITDVSPAAGPVGASVVISGSSFGAEQGSGQVWIGGVAATVTSWTDGAVTATVSAGATSGVAQILQNGVLSNTVDFAVTGGPPRISYITPTSGAPGTAVTIVGTGFGAAQSGGWVLLGGLAASVGTWTDTQVTITVPSAAPTGVVKVYQNGEWSNAVTFTVPSNGSQITLSPNVMSLLIGESRSLQALDDAGAEMAGLVWSSSDVTVVSLSTDDPPVLTAVAAGQATISVGEASADVTVYPGSFLPEGTPIWSHAVTDANLYMAVPNYDAVADTFVESNNGYVEALRADGTVAWTHDVPYVPGYPTSFLPDFGGGLIAFNEQSIARLDPLTGASQTLFKATSYGSQQEGLGLPAIGTDGTVYTVDRNCSPEDCGGTDATEGTYVVGVPVVGGSERFRTPLQNDTWSTVTTCFGGDGTPASGQYHPSPSTMIIAGDGNVYFSYMTTDIATVRTHTDAQPYPDEAYPIFQQLVADVVAHNGPAALADIDALTQVVGSDPFGIGGYITSGQFDYAYNILALDAPQFAEICDRAVTSTTALHLASLTPDGTLSDRVVKQWTGTRTTMYAPQPAWPYYESSTWQTGPADVDIDGPHMITDQDQGAVYSWMEALDCAESVQTDPGCQSNIPAYHLTRLSNGAIASDTVWDQAGYGQSTATGLAAVRPVLQLENGSFAGAFEIGSNPVLLVFDSLGRVAWTSSGYTPRFTTPDGLVASSGAMEIMFDASGNAVRQSAESVVSWRQLSYRIDSAADAQLAAEPVEIGAGYATVEAGNFSHTGTFVGTLPSIEARPIYVLQSFGGSCTTTGGVSVPLGGPALTQYQLERSGLLNGGWLTSQNCSAFFQDPIRAGLADTLTSGVEGQVPYDGRLSGINMYAAGQMPDYFELYYPQLVSAYKRTPVCQFFVDSPRSLIATAQITPRNGQSASAIYVNSNPSVYPFLDGATILHETLHNLTGVGDFLPLMRRLGTTLPYDLKTFVGLETLPGIDPDKSRTTDISDRLREVGCAPPE